MPLSLAALAVTTVMMMEVLFNLSAAMKKTIYQIGMLAAAAFAFVACEKEVFIPTHEVTFSVGKAEGEFKTEVVEGAQSASYKWLDTDKQYFHVKENGNSGTISDEADGFVLSGSGTIATIKASFADTDAPYSYTAVYAKELSNNGNPKLQSEQYPKADNFDPAADILISRASADVTNLNEQPASLQFTMGRPVSVNKMNLTGLEVGEVVKTVTFTLSKSFTGGSYTINSKSFSLNSRTLTLDYTQGGTVEGIEVEGSVFPAYFVCAPVEDASIESVVVTTDQNVYTKAGYTESTDPFYGKTITFAVGTMKRFTMAMSGCGTPISAGVAYTLVSTQADLESGASYLIVGSKEVESVAQYYAFGAQANNNRSGVHVSAPVSGVITIDNTVTPYPVQIVSQGSNYYIIDDYSGGGNNGNYGYYIYNASTTGNNAKSYLRSEQNPDADSKAEWAIEISNGVASIINQNSNSRNTLVMNYNNGSPLFNVYASVGSYSTLALYKNSTPDTRTPVTLSFSPASPAAITLGDSFTEPTLTIDPSNAPVSYSVETVPAGIATIDASTGELTITDAGEITVTASVSDEVNYKPASASYTLEVIDSNIVDYVTLPWSYPDSGAATSAGISAIDGITVNSLGTDYADNNAPYCIKFDGTGDFIQVKTDSAIGEVSVSYKMIGGGNTSTLNILESTDGSTWTAVQDLSISGAQNSTGVLSTTNNFNSASRYVKINFTKGSNVGIGGISITQADGKSDAGISYSPASASVTYGEAFTQPTLSNTHNLSVSYASNNTDVATVAANGTISVVGCGEATITCSWDEQSVSNVTYRSGSATYALTVNKIPVTVAFSDPTTAVEVGNTVTNVASTTPSGLSLTYSSSATGVATVTNAGVVTGVANGNATITASYAGDATHDSASANYQITVGSANDGTLAHPYTVAEALEVCAGLSSGNSTSNQVYVSGIVTTDAKTYNSNYSSLTYYISDDGNTSNHLEVYGGKYVGNSSFSSADQLLSGAPVVIYGYLKNYSGTYEFNANNYIYSLDGVTALPTITKTDITGVSADGVSGSTTTVTLANNSGWTVAVEGDGTIVTSASLSGSTITYSVATNTGSARTGTITVTLSRTHFSDVTATINVSQLAGNGGGSSDPYYVKVTDVTTLSAGDKVLIINTSSQGALPAFTGTSTISPTSLSGKYDSTNDRFPTNDSTVDACAVTLAAPTTAVSGKVVFKLKMSNNNYITKNGTSGTGFNPATSSTEVGGDWTLSMDSNGRVNVKNNYSGSTRCLIWRSGSTNKFGAYASSNINDTEYYNVYLYKLTN